MACHAAPFADQDGLLVWSRSLCQSSQASAHGTRPQGCKPGCGDDSRLVDSLARCKYRHRHWGGERHCSFWMPMAREGRETLSEWEAKRWHLPDSFSVTTGRGRHIYLQYPAGLDVRNSAGKLGLGLDIRGADGYVVAPPSRHISGTSYECAAPDKPLAPVPEWLLSLIVGKTNTHAAPAPATGKAIGKGGRTDRLVSLAGTLHKRGMSVEAITAALLAENTAKCDPPLPGGEGVRHRPRHPQAVSERARCTEGKQPQSSSAAARSDPPRRHSSP